MSRIGLECVLRQKPEHSFDSAKFVLYHWNRPITTKAKYFFHGSILILDPTLTAICNMDALAEPPFLDARWLVHLVYLAAKEKGQLPENIDEFSSYVINTRKISTLINKRIIERENARPYRKNEIDDIVKRAYELLSTRDIEDFEFSSIGRPAGSYPTWNRQSNFDFIPHPDHDSPVPNYMLYHVDNNFCRVIVVDKVSSREMYHFELYGNRDNVLETLSGVGGESAKVRNKYLIGQPVRPEELIHTSNLPDFHECLSKPTFGKFESYSLATVKLYRSFLRFANHEQ